MAIWPLINHVDIYLKADIVKGGIVLVDVPGLLDIVESRAAVARKHYQNLSVTAIVTPCVRAADERTAVNLMTETKS
ncbi:Nuclear GTPase SLIP-GC [Madurella mycetomatis]|uniref:Nuclear GTPase SLIP-GC n=1 Tax=Madurella mycetomatis TaxID=100816 RepID=A0A175WH07_9PEZI|nr:Nuclear GTPase SLIP-GC [Madurella mycetomatis]